MYCINCGVKLEDTESRCPLCGVEAFHPDIVRGEAEPLYPPHSHPVPQPESRTGRIVITTLRLMAVIITVMCDYQINGKILWSGYAAGGILVTYTAVVLPFWFRKPEPGVFVPVTFAAIALYLLYINYATGGNWFFSFALPVTAVMCLIVITVTAVLHRKRKGRLYIWGGTMMVLGAFMPFIEVLLAATFDIPFIGWSIYPLVVLVVLGGALIYLAINRTAREIMERKLFF